MLEANHLTSYISNHLVSLIMMYIQCHLSTVFFFTSYIAVCTQFSLCGCGIYFYISVLYSATLPLRSTAPIYSSDLQDLAPNSYSE